MPTGAAAGAAAGAGTGTAAAGTGAGSAGSTAGSAQGNTAPNNSINNQIDYSLNSFGLGNPTTQKINPIYIWLFIGFSIVVIFVYLKFFRKK